MKKFKWVSASILASLTGLGILSGWAAHASEQVGWLWMIPAGILAGILVFTWMGLRGSRGGLAAFLWGQFPATPVCLRGNVQISTGEAKENLEAVIMVDCGHPIGEISERFLSVAVDLSQVTGGKWWDPAADHIEMSSGSLESPVFDFDRPQLDRMTQALAPLYLRIGGSESDKIFYALNEEKTTPHGYASMLTGRQWARMHSFCERNDCEMMFTLNAGPGTRDADGKWNPAHAEALIRHARERGQRVAMWELGNEVNVFFFVHGMRRQICVEQYLSDLGVLRRLRDRYSPETLLGGQGSAYWPVLGEPLGFFFGFMEGTIRHAAGLLDVLTWHYYPQQSKRCPMASRRAHPARMLEANNLDEAAHWARQINGLRDQYAPGLPIWLAETGNAQCGGAPGLSDTYLAGLWWLDEMGLIAREGQEVVVRQSLTGMDYGLLDEVALAPRPDYWNSLLWRRLMGRKVLPVQCEGTKKLRVYAHSCRKGKGMCLLAVNLDDRRAVRLRLPGWEENPIEKHILTSGDILGRHVLLNGNELSTGANGEIPETPGMMMKAGERPELAPLSYGFFSLRE